MRLTLRTLLAYLDDTLDPAQARQIGEKVAESTVAQELIDKIKRVARRRSITIPSATGPDSADPNLVAEYLDNDLPVEKIAEIEEQALHSDVHLAEIAACHQLLTLIMSEPAKVPPMSRQRMYGIVKGPEVDTNRIVPRVAPATLVEMEVAEEADGDVLVSRRGGPKRMWVAFGLAIGLILAVWQAMRQPDVVTPKPPATPLVVADNTPRPKVAEAPKEAEKPKPADVPVPEPKDQPKEQPKDQPKEQPKEKAPPEAPMMPDKKPDPEVPAVVPPAAKPDLAGARKPSDDTKEVGKLINSGVLLQRSADNAEWKRVPANGSIAGGTRLLALPGIVSEVRLGDAVLELFGTMMDVHQVPMFESSATAFVPAAGFTADVRLDRGRIYLRTALPAGAKVRLRLGDDLFDIALADDKAEVLAERTTIPDGVPFARDRAKQQSAVALGGIVVTQGKAAVQLNLKTDATIVAGPKPLMWSWSSLGAAEAATELSEPSPLWARQPIVNGPDRAAAIEMEQAIKRLPRQLGDASKKIDVAIAELALERPRAIRRLAIYCQAALDDMSIIDAMDDPTNGDSRNAALSAIHNWLGRGPDRAGILFDALIKQKRFSEAEAEAALVMWFGYTEADLKDPRTYANVLDALNSDKLPSRELAIWRLSQLDKEGTNLIRFVSTDPVDTRQRAVQEWKRRIPDGQLPPGRMR